MRSINLIAALAATATLGVAATAEATTYCVGSPTVCPAGSPAHTNLQDALDAAKNHAGHDVVRLGNGTFETATGFKYSPIDVATNTVEVVGEGSGTVLKADAPAKPSFVTLSVDAAGPSRVAKLAVEAPDRALAASEIKGIVVSSGVVAEDVAVRDSGNVPNGAELGILVKGGSGVRRSSVSMNDGATGIQVSSDKSAPIADTVVEAGHGISTNYSAGVVDIRRTRIRATRVGVTAIDGITTIESSLIRVAGPDAIGLYALSATGTMVLASHLTIFGSGADSEGVAATGSGDHDVQVKLDNSIIHGFAHGVRRSSTDVDSDASVFLTNVNYAAAADLEQGTGAIVRTNTIQQKPGFIDPAAGDYRLYPTSPLVDKGRVESYVWIMGQDLAGLDREVGARRDLGAFESQALAPVAVIAGAGDVDPGQALALSGAQSHDQDPGGVVVGWDWTFGDGTTASGKDVQHAWAQPGTYQVALTVTDTSGKSHTAKASVVVRTPPVETSGSDESGGGIGGGTGGGESGGGTATPTVTTAGADRTAPAISRLSRRARTLRFSLSETASVVARVQRRVGRKFRAASAAKRLSGKAGRNAVKLAKLRPGRYRATVVAVDAAGNRSVKRLAFRVV